AIVREHEPDVLLAHHVDDLHPDHRAVGELARAAWYLSGLSRLADPASSRPARRPSRLYHFMGHVPFEPTFVVDIGPVREDTVGLCARYASRLAAGSAEDRGQHCLFGAATLARMETKARAFGERIGARYGEPLLHRGPLPCLDPFLAAGGHEG